MHVTPHPCMSHPTHACHTSLMHVTSHPCMSHLTCACIPPCLIEGLVVLPRYLLADGVACHAIKVGCVGPHLHTPCASQSMCLQKVCPSGNFKHMDLHLNVGDTKGCHGVMILKTSSIPMQPRPAPRPAPHRPAPSFTSTAPLQSQISEQL